MIEEILIDLRLSEKEIAIYTALLSLGKATAARISGTTGIHRTTVYTVCDELVLKGYITEDKTKEIICYSPTPPAHLTKIAKRDRQALVERELKLEELARAVQSLPQSKKYVVPKTRFVEGEEKITDFLLERAPEWHNGYPKTDYTWYGFQDHSFVESEKYRAWIDVYWKEHHDLTQVYLLTNASEEAEREEDRRYVGRNIKFWKKGFDFTVTQWVVGDYSVMIMTRDEPHYLVETHDAVYADNMRKLFKNLWEEIT